MKGKNFITCIFNDKGFTLIEILVVLVVSSIMILSLYAAHRSVMTSIYKLTGVAEFYENINLAIIKIDHDISCLHFNKNNKKLCFIGESNYETPYNGKFNFVTINHNDLLVTAGMKNQCTRADVGEVGYFLEPMEEVPGLFNLMRREETLYDDDPESGGDSNILLENVVDIKFEFRNKFSRDWSNKVDSRDAFKVPSAVKTSLILKDYSGKEETIVFTTYLNRQR